MKKTLLKKILLIALGAAMIVSAVACTNTGNPEPTEKKPEDATTAAKTTAEATTAATTAPLYGPARPGTVYNETVLNVSEHLSDVFRTLGRTYTKSGSAQADIHYSIWYGAE